LVFTTLPACPPDRPKILSLMLLCYCTLPPPKAALEIKEALLMLLRAGGSRVAGEECRKAKQSVSSVAMWMQGNHTINQAGVHSREKHNNA
jgi:hypothetical protein